MSVQSNEQLLLTAHAAVAAGSLRSPAAFVMIAPQQNCGRSALREFETKMSFHISVVLPEHLQFINQVPDEDDDMDKWIEECKKLNLYDAPLDAGAVVYEYWSKIADRLRLPLLAALYNHGLKLFASEVPALETELEQLERHWQENELAGVERFNWDQASAKKDLKERLNYLREAAEVAKRNRGVLIVS